MRLALGCAIASLAAFIGMDAADRIAPERLRCEYLANPIGIDTPSPRFSWDISAGERGTMQTAYRILVAASEQALRADRGDKWDSGKVASDRSVNVPYHGRALSSGEKCYWKVKIWDNHGSVSAWSTPASFEMGLLSPGEWHGEWVAAGRPSDAAPLLRKVFQLQKPFKRARAYISGLGWYELYLNGKRVGDHVLDPAMTEYSRRILYATYDVTSFLVPGENAIGVTLGNGWFSQPPESRAGPLRKYHIRYGAAPQLLFEMRIDYTDGTVSQVTSDETWRSHDGPIIRNSLQGGESYDARLEIPDWAKRSCDDAQWPHVRRVPSPGGRLESQVMPAIKVMQTWRAVSVTNPKPGSYIYDFGRVITGWTRLRVKGPRSTTVSLLYSERIIPATGLPDMQNHPEPQQTDYYTLKGDAAGEEYEPRFTFHPFRYVQVKGFPGAPDANTLECRLVHSAVDDAPAFESSNALINKIHELAFWTIQNALYGMPIDEPHREPYPYLEPGETPANLFSRRDMPLLWTKWLADSQDAQREDGWLPETVPEYMRAPLFDPAWAGNYPIAVWYVYQYYDDRRILENHYPNMKRWVDYLTGIAGPDHIVRTGHLGDHMLAGMHPGEEQIVSNETPPPLCWTGYYYRDASILAEAATLLGKTVDLARYRQLASEIKDAFNREWFNADTNQYATGSQTSNLFALALGLVPEAHRRQVAANVAREILSYGGHLHTGIIGTTAALEALPNSGYGVLLYDVVNRTTYPGWGYMIDQGATTIWERWGRTAPGKVGGETMTMFATIDEFMYGALAGIQGPPYYGPKTIDPGFKDIEMRPVIPAGLRYAKASFETVRGRVSSGWSKQEDGDLIVQVRIPANSRARVHLPKPPSGSVIQESGRPVWRDGVFIPGTSGVSDATAQDGYISFAVGSGAYSFHVTAR